LLTDSKAKCAYGRHLSMSRFHVFEVEHHFLIRQLLGDWFESKKFPYCWVKIEFGFFARKCHFSLKEKKLFQEQESKGTKHDSLSIKRLLWKWIMNLSNTILNKNLLDNFVDDLNVCNCIGFLCVLGGRSMNALYWQRDVNDCKRVG